MTAKTRRGAAHFSVQEATIRDLRVRLRAVEADLDRCGQQRAADVQQMLRLQVLHQHWQARAEAAEAALARAEADQALVGARAGRPKEA